MSNEGISDILLLFKNVLSIDQYALEIFWVLVNFHTNLPLYISLNNSMVVKTVLENIQVGVYIPASIYLFNVNNGHARTMCEICSNLSIKTSKQTYWCHCSSLLVTLKIFYILFWYFHCSYWTSRFRCSIFLLN